MLRILMCAAVGALFIGSQAVAQAPTQNGPLRERAVGWKLISWETVRANGQALNLIMGPHPTGLIMYSPNGYMAVQVMHDPRPTLNYLTAAGDEFKQAYLGYYAYWGTYTINEADSTVEHNIQSSLYPVEVGRKFKRSLLFDGAKLVLTTPPFKAGIVILHDPLPRLAAIGPVPPQSHVA
jgi:Lipocalin-like domain